MNKTKLQAILEKLNQSNLVEIHSDNPEAEHKAFDKILRTFGLKKDIRISKDADKSTLIFLKKS